MCLLAIFNLPDWLEVGEQEANISPTALFLKYFLCAILSNIKNFIQYIKVSTCYLYRVVNILIDYKI